MAEKIKWEGLGLSEEAFELERERLQSESARRTADESLAALNQVSPEAWKAFERVAPQIIWQLFSKAMPEMMKRVDVMLINGMTPEWILMRGNALEFPPEIQTALINSLHWRQAELRKKRSQRMILGRVK